MTNPHDPRVMMGFTTPADQKVALPVRDWSAIKLALWRNRTGWEIVMRSASELLSRCVHSDECPGAKMDSEPCLPDCPDREQRMSALVILNAARMFAPIDSRRPASEHYSPPSREYYSELWACYVAAEAELEALRVTVATVVTPPPNQDPLLPAKPPAQLNE